VRVFRDNDTLLDVSIDAPAPGSWFRYRDWKAGARQLMLALHAQLVEPLALSGYA
jgi:hypothetical protein